MAKKCFCRAEIMEMIGSEIEVGSIIRVRKDDELPINLLVTKVARGWYQGLKLILKCEEMEKAAITLKKGKDVVYVMPTAYSQYVGVENSIIKGIRKTDCVGAEGYIVGKVINQHLLDSILLIAKATVKGTSETKEQKQSLNFEKVLQNSDKLTVVNNLRLEKVPFLKSALQEALYRKNGAMKPVIAGLQKDCRKKSSEIKKELNTELSIWISEVNAEMLEYTVSYFLKKAVEAIY